MSGNSGDREARSTSQSNCSIRAVVLCIVVLCISLRAPPRYHQAPMRKSHKPMFLKAFA